MFFSYNYGTAPAPHFKTAVLIDGGFYRRRATKLFGTKTPPQRAAEIYQYSMRHAYDRLSSNIYGVIFLKPC